MRVKIIQEIIITQVPTTQTSSDFSPFLIAGLGNPGREYRDTRHNVGFMVLDRLAERLAVTFSRVEMQSLVTKTDFQGKKLILAKPQTYMNLSGKSIASLTRFYKIYPEYLLVVYDEVDLPFGSLRLRANGGSAGHKGMGSIIETLGKDTFPRLRIGIGRPSGRKSAAGYVLDRFTKDEQEFLTNTLDRAVEAVCTFITQGVDTAMNQYNSSLDDSQ